MERIIRRLALFLFPFLVAACAISYTARMNELMRSFEGRHSSDVIANWGPPQRIYDDGQGGKILIYTDSSYVIKHGETRTYERGPLIGGGFAAGVLRGLTPDSQTVTDPTVIETRTKYRAFWTSGDGYVYRWAWRDP